MKDEERIQLEQKNQLVNSKEWQKIKNFQLDNIIKLSNGLIEPLLLKGMLKNIYDTEIWAKQFEIEKNKTKEN